MTKQLKITVLIFAVLLTWGIVGAQIYSYLKPTEEALIETNEPFTVKYEPEPVQELYMVTKHKRDPFTGAILKTKSKTFIQPTKEAIIFPNIVYNGMIKSTSKTSFILTISGQQYIMSVGQQRNEITLLFGDDKIIKVRYKGRQQEFIKS